MCKLEMGRTDDSWLQINEHSTGNVLPSASLAEEGVERVVADAGALVRGHVAVGHDAVFHAVELPAGVADLDSGLANVDGDDFPLRKEESG